MYEFCYLKFLWHINFRFYCDRGATGPYIFVQKHGAEMFHVHYVSVIIENMNCTLEETLLEMWKTAVKEDTLGLFYIK